jgi:hypothetical protein
MCDVARCKRPVLLTYAAFDKSWRIKDVEVCKLHWDRHCDEEKKFDLRTHFNKRKK